jgi:NTP pyrophosphatase (non-canonical NTP hydrolase)
MTTNFKLNLPYAVVAKLLDDAQGVRGMQMPEAENGIPSYPLFVQHLMKGMNTPAEELHHACTGIAGEGGEILDWSKKVWIYGKELDLEKFIKELGDLRFYYQAVLNHLGITDEQVIAQNILKLRARYSEGVYSDAQAIAQADKDPVIGRDRNAPPMDRRFMGRPKLVGVGPWVVGRVFRDNAENLWNAVRSLGNGEYEECRTDPSHNRELMQQRADALNAEGDAHG